jgi:hypothetical protein
VYLCGSGAGLDPGGGGGGGGECVSMYGICHG